MCFIAWDTPQWGLGGRPGLHPSRQPSTPPSPLLPLLPLLLALASLGVRLASAPGPGEAPGGLRGVIGWRRDEDTPARPRPPCQASPPPQSHIPARSSWQRGGARHLLINCCMVISRILRALRAPWTLRTGQPQAQPRASHIPGGRVGFAIAGGHWGRRGPAKALAQALANAAANAARAALGAYRAGGQA